MKKNYYAIIPANVRYDNDIRANAKLLYGEITALCNEKGFCWANNSYFADLYKVSKETISRWISELVDQGYLTIDLIYKEGTNQIINRYIRINHEPIDEMINTPIDEKVKDNNTKIFNNTSNNTSNKTVVGKPDSVDYKKIIQHLNKVADKNYRSTTRKTMDLIKARFNEGFTVNDFIKVIDIKSAEWKDSEKWSKYLQPTTLFGNKFEGYLNQVPPQGPKDDGYDYGF